MVAAAAAARRTGRRSTQARSDGACDGAPRRRARGFDRRDGLRRDRPAPPSRSGARGSRRAERRRALGRRRRWRAMPAKAIWRGGGAGGPCVDGSRHATTGRRPAILRPPHSRTVVDPACRRAARRTCGLQDDALDVADRAARLGVEPPGRASDRVIVLNAAARARVAYPSSSTTGRRYAPRPLPADGGRGQIPGSAGDVVHGPRRG